MKHRRFKKVAFDNKKRLFKLEYTSGLKIECPYSALSIRGKVVAAGPDAEVGNHSFFFTLLDGHTDYVPYDQPLHIVQNPEYVRQETLCQMTLRLNELISEAKIPKREIARRLNTSLSQVARLLDVTNYNKDMARLVEIGAVLNYELKWEFKKAA